LINATSSWADFGNGAGINVSIIDSGINTLHPGLAGQVVLEQNFATQYSSEDLGDYCNHGTAVACVVGCNDATYKGIAPGAKLFNAKAGFKADTGQCVALTSELISAIDWSVAHGVQVIQISFGAGGTCYEDPLSVAVNNTGKIVPIVVAAGNGGPSAQSIAAPACAENAIAVGASNGGAVADYSSRGPTDYGLAKPDIVAPGSVVTANNDGTFGSHTGTSFSAPHVSGVVALMLQQKHLTPFEVKQLLKSTAVDLGYDENTQGAGRVDAWAAVNAAVQQPETVELEVSSLFQDPAVTVPPYVINATIRNNGNSPADDVFASIIAPSGIDVVSEESVQIGSLQGLSEAKASWLVNPLQGGNYTITVAANSSNAVSAQGVLEVVFENPKLATSTASPVVSSVSKPFTINATVTNSGGVAAQNVMSVLSVPSRLTILDGASRNIGVLQPHSTVFVHWGVSASRTGTYSASIATTASNAQANTTHLTIIVNKK
jgi:serine protease AprX